MVDGSAARDSSPSERRRSGIKLIKDLVERLGRAGELLRIYKEHRQELLRETLRTYFTRFDMQHSIFPDENDKKIKNVFSAPVTP